MKLSRRIALVLALVLILSLSGMAMAATVLTLNHDGAIEHPYHAGSLKFAELVEAKTNGSIKIDIFPASQIASGTKAVEYVQLGTLDIALAATTSMENFVPKVGVVGLPFVFANKAEVFKTLDGEVGKYLSELCEEKGFVILAWWDNGFRSFSNSKRPVVTPEDIKGLKIRTPESTTILKMYEALGATSTAMAVSEVYTALSTGVVDGQDNTVSNFKNNKYYEIQKYLSISNHIYTSEPLVMSTDRFYSLTEDEQKAIREAALEAGAYQREVSVAAEQKDLDEIAAFGVEIVQVDTEAFKARVQPVYDFYGDLFKDLLEQIRVGLEN